MKPKAIIGLLWLAWIIYWIASARGVKKSAPGSPGRRAMRIRVFFVVGMIVLLQFSGVRIFLGRHDPLFLSTAVHDLGVVLCVAGLGFSVWARRHLGRNWGVPMSLKEGHELVTTGPYALVRHPIYTGILFALFGTVLAGGMLALLFFVFFCPYFLYAMWTEDRLMTGQFPGEYAEYKRRTKLVIPWVW